MRGADWRTLAAAAAAGALLLGCAAVIYGSTRPANDFGYFAYEPLSGVTYHGYFFDRRSYSSESTLNLARLNGFFSGAAVGLLLGLLIGWVAVLRQADQARSRRRLMTAGGVGLVVGGCLVVVLHFTRHVITISPGTRVADNFAHPGWWPSALVVPVLGAFCGLALGLLAGNEKRPVTTTE